MAGSAGTRITLAAVQARSRPGELEANLGHAEPLVEQAAAAVRRTMSSPRPVPARLPLAERG